MLLEPDERGASLDGAGVAALLAAARGGPVDPEAAVTLASGRLDAALSVLADPLVTLDLVVAGGTVRLEHRGWVTTELAVLLAGVHAPDGPAGSVGPAGSGGSGGPAGSGAGAGEWRLVTMAPDLLTAGLVRLTRMRPRRDLVEAPTDVGTGAGAGVWADVWAADLVAADPEARAAARATLGPVGAGFAWRLRAAWPGGERLLCATDGPAGLHLADPVGGELRRVSNTFCYRVLSTLLPTDREIDREVDREVDRDDATG